MIPHSVFSRLRQQYSQRIQDIPVDQPPPMELTIKDHDLILRYSLVFIAVVVGFCSLYVTRAITLPIVAGIICGLTLGPLTDKLIRLGIPQGLAAGLLVGAGAFILTLMMTFLAAPFSLWVGKLPDIVSAFREKISGFLIYLKQFEGMTFGLSQGTPPAVAINDHNPWIDLAVNSSAAAGGMLIFVATIYFYLVTRRHFKARVLRLCIARDTRQMAGSFFEQIERRVAAYFGVVTVINLVMGLATGVIAWAGGLPVVLLWATGAFILNYIAFIGPILMTFLIFGVGLLGQPSLWNAVWPAGLYFLVHLVEANVVTPVAVGRRLTVSPFLVFISFIFWLWLWGPVGAILSTPILLVATVAFEVLAAQRAAQKEEDTQSSISNSHDLQSSETVMKPNTLLVGDHHRTGGETTYYSFPKTVSELDTASGQSIPSI